MTKKIGSLFFLTAPRQLLHETFHIAIREVKKKTKQILDPSLMVPGSENLFGYMLSFFPFLGVFKLVLHLSYIGISPEADNGNDASINSLVCLTIKSGTYSIF